MQKFMKKRKARGFTLVELLIVIIIIGILAGALLLAAGAGTDKAKATKIVSDMRGLKTAAIMYYADYGDWLSGDVSVSGSGTSTRSESLDQYMDQDLEKVDTEYVFITSDDEVYIKVTSSDIDSNVAKRLNEMEDSGLIVETGGYFMRVK